ncbi:MAG: elongation factor Ts [Bacteroidetes bacterium]|nr:elongation factor Ts [Bacteroidota bacterium]
MSTATITAADINKLRQTTGAGMMDCRKALVESDGDFEKAIDYLRKKGQKVAALRSDREAKEGVIIATTTADNKTGFITTLACETDFVAKNSDFVAFAQSIIDVAVKNNVKSLEELLAANLGGVTVADKINDQVAKIGEKIQLTRFERVDAEGVAAYIHGAYRMGVLVGLTKNTPAVLEAGKDVAMQIAAMKPVAVDADSVPAEIVDRERSIVTEQIKNDPKMAGKPDAMIEKIADGKLNAFFKENTLTAQAYVKDASKTVGDYLKSVDATVKVTEFKRVQLG